MALAYSYIRFSSKKQELGASLKRQLELAQAYAAEHKLTLDDHSYRDLGVSAWKGKHRTEGKLGMLLAALEAGVIKKGAYILIEALDRLSREDVDDALRQFLNIIHYGVTVVTLADQREYSKAQTRRDGGMSLMQSIMYMGQANADNERKSQRVKDAWDRKYALMRQGIVATGMSPSWLKPGPKRRVDDWIVDKKKADVVRLIFDLALSGHGTPSIARKLNQDSVPTMVNAPMWSFAIVAAILKNPAVTGVFRRKDSNDQPIIAYYPPLITETKFQLTQSLINKRRWIPQNSVDKDNTESAANLFAGFAYCNSCQSKMRAVGTSTITGRSATKHHTYLRCQTAFAGGDCEEKRLPYVAMERAVVERLHKALTYRITKSSGADIDDPIVSLVAEKADLEKRRKRLIKLAEDDDDADVIERLAELKRDIAAVAEKIRVAVPVVHRQTTIDEARVLLGKLRDKPDRELRIRVRAELSRLVEGIYCCSAGPTVAVKFFEANRNVEFIELAPYMETVGGNRRLAVLGPLSTARTAK
jgi:DNA invertase Pin-like site-specific DNA recombinase